MTNTEETVQGTAKQGGDSMHARTPIWMAPTGRLQKWFSGSVMVQLGQHVEESEIDENDDKTSAKCVNNERSKTIKWDHNVKIVNVMSIIHVDTDMN